MRRRLYHTSKINYDDYANGIYILHSNGKLYTSSNWDTSDNSKSVGVVYKDSSCRFVIAKNDIGKIIWGDTVSITGIPTYEANYDSAKEDLTGKTSTDKIVAQLGTSSIYAARSCLEFTFPDGRKGYLPANGEMYKASSNSSSIDSCLSLIGGTAFSTSTFYWTTTQWHWESAWGWFWGGSNTGNQKYNKRFVRAFAEL